jgi:hypothetical protein
MYPISEFARRVITRSHTIDVKAVVVSPVFGTRNIPILDGEVTDDAGSQVRRTATIVTDPNLWPVTSQDLLTPFGTTCTIYRGIVLPGYAEPEWVPQGLYHLDKNSRTRRADSISAATLKLVDPSQRVAEARLEAPEQTVEGATYVAEITRYIRGALGLNYPVIDLTGSTAVCPVMEIARERWADGVVKLADAIAAEVLFDDIGQAVIRRVPTLADPPVWYAKTGPGGNVLETSEEWNRDLVWNEWIVSGARSDGTEPVTVTVADTDPLSATYISGPFGKKTRFYSSPVITTAPQATAAGQAMLSRSQGLACKVDFSLFPNPALRSGDVIDLEDAELGRAVHIIDKVAVPLTPQGAQPLQTRSDLVLQSES